MPDRVGRSPTSDHSPEVRSIPGFAEFAEAFCRGFNAHKGGITDDDGEAFMRHLMVEYEKWQGKRVDRQNELRQAVEKLLALPDARIIGKWTTHTFAREVLGA